MLPFSCFYDSSSASPDIEQGLEINKRSLSLPTQHEMENQNGISLSFLSQCRNSNASSPLFLSPISSTSKRISRHNYTRVKRLSLKKTVNKALRQIVSHLVEDFEINDELQDLISYSLPDPTDQLAFSHFIRNVVTKHCRSTLGLFGLLRHKEDDPSDFIDLFTQLVRVFMDYYLDSYLGEVRQTRRLRRAYQLIRISIERPKLQLKFF